MSQVWETVVTTALMGTDRKPLNLNGGEGRISTLFKQLDGEEIHHQLLGAASAIALSAQASMQPAEFQGTLPLPCGEENQPECDDAVSQMLQAVLSGTYFHALPELLDRIKASGQRVSGASMIKLLNLGRRLSEIRAPIQSIIGKRGQWIAQFNSAWSYIHEEVVWFDDAGQLQANKVKETWETGTQATRLALLEMLRERDATFALELLSLSWKQESAKDRAAFLQVLKTQLNPDDEAFLEAALKDRSKDVKAIAASLLAQIPSSQLCARMIERVQSFISIREAEEQIELVITLPKTDEKGDGLIASKSQTLGQRGHLLMQIIAAVPLGYWDVAPTTLIEAACGNDNHTALLLGWQVATLRQTHQDWAKALIAHYLQDVTQAGNQIVELTQLLPHNEREGTLSQWLTELCQQQQWEQWRQGLTSVIQGHPYPSSSLSQDLLQCFVRDFKADCAKRSKRIPYHLRSLVHQLSYYLHPDCYETAMTWAETLNKESLNSNHQSLWDDLLDVLRFRQRMAQLFLESGTKETDAP